MEGIGERKLVVQGPRDMIRNDDHKRKPLISGTAALQAHPREKDTHKQSVGERQGSGATRKSVGFYM